MTSLSPACAEQYAALTTGAGLCDLPDRTRIALTGNDRQKFLHNFCTNDVKRLAPGEGCEAFITSVQGKVLGHGHIFCENERLVFDSVPGQAETLLPHLDKYLITEAVEFHDLTAAEHGLLLAGANAADLLAKAADRELPAEPNAHLPATLGGVEVRIARLPLAGPASFYITCAAGSFPVAREALLAAGALACESEALDVVRVENGYPLFGRDITTANLPQEVDRNAQAISFTKGCYLGQETVARIDALGHVNRLLRGVRFEGEEVPQPGDTLTAEPGSEQSIGQVTSSVFSPRLSAPLALAYVRSQHAAAGSPLGWKNAAAQVVPLPVE